jgi:hypothetical protein
MILKCRLYLQVIAVIHIVTGLLLPFVVQIQLFDVYYQHLALAFNLADDNSTDAIKFLVGIIGPTISSWGILFLFSVNTAFTNPSPKSWWFIVIACAIWAVYDSLFSLSYGIYMNAIFNGVVFICIMIPMLMSREFFVTKPDSKRQ